MKKKEVSQRKFLRVDIPSMSYMEPAPVSKRNSKIKKGKKKTKGKQPLKSFQSTNSSEFSSFNHSMASSSPKIRKKKVMKTIISKMAKPEIEASSIISYDEEESKYPYLSYEYIPTKSELQMSRELVERDSKLS